MTEAESPATLRLTEVPPASAGRTFGLCAGDTLVAVNGKAFHGDVRALQHMIAGAAGPQALEFRRGGSGFTVLAATVALGRWESVPALAFDGPARRVDPAFLRGWEVMRAGDGTYDLFAQRLPVAGLVAPQLWALQMRLWLPCAMLLAALAAGGIVHPLLGLAVQAAAAAHLRRAHGMYLRLDRRGRGLGFHMVVAARTEALAHDTHRALHPADRYLFAPIAKSAETVAV